MEAESSPRDWEEELAAWRSSQAPLVLTPERPHDQIDQLSLTQRGTVVQQTYVHRGESDSERGVPSGVRVRRWLTTNEIACMVGATSCVGNGTEHIVMQPLEPFSPVVKTSAEMVSAMVDVLAACEEYTRRLNQLYEILSQHVGSEEAGEVVVPVEVGSEQVRDGTGHYLCQSCVPELDMPHLQMLGGYAELASSLTVTGDEPLPVLDVPMIELYQQMNEILILRYHSECFDGEAFLEMQRSAHLRQLVNACKGNKTLHDYLSCVVRAMVEYTRKTGEIFDIAGGNNIIFFERADEGIYTARMIDPLFPDPFALQEAQEGLRTLQQGKRPDNGTMISLLNVLNYTRTMNGLLRILGISDSLDIVPPDLAGSDTTIDFRAFVGQSRICFHRVRSTER